MAHGSRPSPDGRRVEHRPHGSGAPGRRGVTWPASWRTPPRSPGPETPSGPGDRRLQGRWARIPTPPWPVAQRARARGPRPRTWPGVPGTRYGGPMPVPTATRATTRVDSARRRRRQRIRRRASAGLRARSPPTARRGDSRWWSSSGGGEREPFETESRGGIRRAGQESPLDVERVEGIVDDVHARCVRPGRGQQRGGGRRGARALRELDPLSRTAFSRYSRSSATRRLRARGWPCC